MNGRRILYVEDNEDNIYMLKSRLERRGFTVFTAADGAAGVAAVRRLRPDLVLMDLSLPVLDGWEATRQIKADPVTQAIPVVALTAHAFDADRSRAGAAGVDGYLSKPLDFPLLLRTIGDLLERTHD